MKKQENTGRLIGIAVIYIVIAVVFIGRLLYLQVSGQDYYTMSRQTGYVVRYEKIQAQRGEIYDRNGAPLVTNDYEYAVMLDYATRPSTQTAINEMLLDIAAIAARSGETDKLVQARESLLITVVSDGLRFAYPDGFFDTARGRRYKKLVDGLGADDEDTIEDEARILMYHYGILARERNDNPGTEAVEYDYYYNYTYEMAKKLLTVRLDMDLSEFSAVQPYAVAQDVSLAFITGVEESFSRGITVRVSAKRVYNYPGYASHILGTMGKITSDNVAYYTERGYSYDAVVGISGVEASFEEYLRGQDGVLKITEDGYGNVVGTEVYTEPVAGRDVYLTIDIGMQMCAEKALAENIFKIRQDAKWSKPLSGEDAAAGAMTVIDCDTAEVLAICSYPTYNLENFQEDLPGLLSDETSPMYNRALSGLYAPGSTFKVGVALAALEEGIIEKDTVIDTKGIYTYYEESNYTPRCWLYLMAGRSHGPISVVEAIQESCNYFFYDVGRQLTIQKMNEYCALYGLGQPTGIELPEKTGILAGPDYRNDNGLGKWSPGDTLQAAIGQSDNQFNPLQISSYIASILNGGVRYKAHLLYEVREYTGELVFKNSPSVASEYELEDDILDTLKEGMKGVMDNGSAASVFSGYEISVGGKTGTAQVSDKKSDNGIMTAFAPFEDPEIVITCIIEQASGGTEAGYCVRDVFDYYFDVDAIRAAAEAEKARAEAEAAEAETAEN